MQPLPPITKAVMLICVGFYCLGVIVPDLAHALALWSYSSPRFGFWQVLTHPLEHESTAPLFFNLFGLYMIGTEVERQLGRRRYVSLILASTLTAAFTMLLIAGAMGIQVRASGISGALFGMLLVFGVQNGERVIVPMIPPIPMKVKYLVTGIGAVELLLGFSGPSGPAHLAHLGGMVGAFLLMQWWRRDRRR